MSEPVFGMQVYNADPAVGPVGWYAVAGGIDTGQSYTFQAAQTFWAGTSAVVPVTVQGTAGQTANLSEWRDSSNNLLSSISALGDFNSNRIIYSTRLVESVTPNAGGMGGTTTIDYSVSGNIYAFNGASTANGTLNFTNLPTNLIDGNKVTTMTIIVNQGATGYIPNTIQIDGVGQTVRWLGGTTPTPTNGAGKIDIFNFTLYRTSSLAWVVLGNANLNF